MKKFMVYWSKTYIASGQEIVEAECREQAEDEVYKILGDLEGSMAYYPDEDYVNAYEVPKDS